MQLPETAPGGQYLPQGSISIRRCCCEMEPPREGAEEAVPRWSGARKGPTGAPLQFSNDETPLRSVNSVWKPNSPDFSFSFCFFGFFPFYFSFTTWFSLAYGRHGKRKSSDSISFIFSEIRIKRTGSRVCFACEWDW